MSKPTLSDKTSNLLAMGIPFSPLGGEYELHYAEPKEVLDFFGDEDVSKGYKRPYVNFFSDFQSLVDLPMFGIGITLPDRFVVYRSYGVGRDSCGRFSMAVSQFEFERKEEDTLIEILDRLMEDPVADYSLMSEVEEASG